MPKVAKSYSTEDTLPGMYTFGQNLINLGTALQDRRTHLEDVVVLAMKCGLNLKLLITPKPEEKENA